MSLLRGIVAWRKTPGLAPKYESSGRGTLYGKGHAHKAVTSTFQRLILSKGMRLPLLVRSSNGQCRGWSKYPLLLAKKYLVTRADLPQFYRVLTSQGCQYLQVSGASAKHSLEVFVYGLNPESVGDEALCAVRLLEEIRADIGMIALGHLDYERILETFSTEKLLLRRTIEPVDVVASRANGQYIPVIQEMLLRKTPCYLIGRDRLVEMGALGQELLLHPKEVYVILWQIIRGIASKNGSGGKGLSPSLEKVLAEEGSEFCVRRIQQYLHEWEDSPLASAEPLQAFSEDTFLRKWLWGRNKSETLLRRRSQQLSLARPPLPDNLKKKKTWRILLVCDKTLERRLAERLGNDLPCLLLKKPDFERMHRLQDTCATKFHLCIMIYIVAPVVLGLRLAWKALKYAYIEHVVKGSTVSVSGDKVLEKLSVKTADGFNSESGNIEVNSEGDQDKYLEVTERRLFGLKHTVRDRSRD